jgi:hypothetical protein
MSIDSKIVERLQALLNKTTENGCTEAEAQTAMEAAQRIAIKHNLDLAQVLSSSKDDKSGGLETDRVDLQDAKCSKRRPHHDPIASVLMAVFDVQFIWVGGYNNPYGLKVCIIGEKTDVALATYCWQWLCELFPKLYKDFTKSEGLTPQESHNDIRRKSFFMGLAMGMKESNRRQRCEVQKGADGESFALVLVKKEEIVNARAAQEFPRLKQVDMGKRERKFDHHALGRGVQKGREIHLNCGLTAGANREELS